MRLPRSEKLRGMIKQGIPHSLRPQLWLRLSGALEKKHKSDLTYKDIVKASANDHLMTSKQIEKVNRSGDLELHSNVILIMNQAKIFFHFVAQQLLCFQALMCCF